MRLSLAGAIHLRVGLFNLPLRDLIHQFGLGSLRLLRDFRRLSVTSLGPHPPLLCLIARTLMASLSLNIFWGVALLRVMLVPPQSMGGFHIIMGGVTSVILHPHLRLNTGVLITSLGGF
jgi:hypothetical protein